MTELFEWWNLIYVLSFFLAFLYATISAMGLAGHGAHAEASPAGLDHDVDAHLDADHDLGFDHDVDVDHDIGLDHDVDVHVDVDHDVSDLAVDHDLEAHVDIDHDLEAHVDVEAHAEVEHEVALDHEAHVEHGLLEEALTFLGIGRVPLSVVLMTFLLTFAVVGWSVNLLLKGVVPGGGVVFLASCPAAVICAVGGTRLLARTLGRWLKPFETAAVRRASLVGRVATACLPVTQDFGQALVRDEHGALHKVVCRVAPDRDDIPKGQKVLLVRYVEVREPRKRAAGHYIVMPFDVPEI